MNRIAALALAFLLLLSSVAFAAGNNVFVMEDFGPWGETYPGWYNVGWRYDDSFDTSTITALEVGLKDAKGKLIVKYTATGDQIDFQDANGYVSGTKQSSAPFGKDIPEGPQEDWSVVYGPAFEAFEPTNCYVIVTVGNTSYKLVNGTLPTGDGAQLMLWSSMVAAAFVGFVVLNKKRVSA